VTSKPRTHSSRWMPAVSEICWHSPLGVATLREIFPGIGNLLSYCNNITLSAFVHIFRTVRVSSPSSTPTLYLLFNRYRGSIAGVKSVGA